MFHTACSSRRVDIKSIPFSIHASQTTREYIPTSCQHTSSMAGPSKMMMRIHSHNVNGRVSNVEGYPRVTITNKTPHDMVPSGLTVLFLGKVQYP